MSDDWNERADKIFVGGVNSPVRSFRRVGGNPIVIQRAKGAFVEDSRGNKFLDLVMSYGPHLFGHSYEPIRSKLAEALDRGFCYGMTGETEILWGEKLIEFLPKGWKVRALSSGTEACMTALRLARGSTGRDLIVKCSGHYHGHIDSLLYDAGSGVATLGGGVPAPESGGLAKGLSQNIAVVAFNDVNSLRELFQKQGNRIAAFILEPVMGNMGVVLPEVEFLQVARDLTKSAGAILVFDEVMTGFRVAAHSAHGRFGVRPDLICFGKIVGGGTPLAALVGPEYLMDHLSPVGKVYQAGTLSGNPLSTAAGLAMLSEIQERDPYSELEELGAELEELLVSAARKKGLPMSVVRCASMLSCHFRASPPRNSIDAQNSDHEGFRKFFWKAIEKGVMLPPSPFEACFLSVAHIPHKGQLFERLEQALTEI